MKLVSCLLVLLSTCIMGSLKVTPNPKRGVDYRDPIPNVIIFHPTVTRRGETEYRAEVTLFNHHEGALLAFRVLASSPLIRISGDDGGVEEDSKYFGSIAYGKPATIVCNCQRLFWL